MKNIAIHLNRLQPMKYIIYSILIFTIFSCRENEDSIDSSNTENHPNILLIIADDLGKDVVKGFEEGSVKAETPNIENIKNNGLTFTRFWTYPSCSPTRASILTGKYGLRTGVKWAGDIIDVSETSLQTYIHQQTNGQYATAVVGKWHLSGNDTSINPEVFGIDYYAGLIRGQAQSYYNWQLTENTENNLESSYATTKFTDLAIDWINQQSKPWFMWLAYNAPHTPFHVPPSEMHNQGDLPAYTEGLDPLPYYIAAVEAMDYQIGRLMQSIPSDELENTTIIILGDNGTPNEVAQAPYLSSTSKGTLYQGGINTPLIMYGKNVQRTGEDDNPISSTDLFATISALAGSEVNTINDSKSFKSLLDTENDIEHFQYVEKLNEGSDRWTLSDGKYKLIDGDGGLQEFFDLQSDPYETNNLLDGNISTEELEIKNQLEEAISSIRE